MTNKTHTTLYVGVTSDLKRRIEEHKSGLNNGSFTARYKLYKLVYYETFFMIDEAIAQEKQIKGESRKKKEELINKLNPEWRDLYDDVLSW
jgi:putative endonuclease